MTPDTTNTGGTNRDKGSDANAGKPQNKRGKKNRNRNKGGAQTRKEPTFIGLHTAIKAVVSDEPGLDPLSAQLERLEKEVIAHAQSNMTAYVASSLRKREVFNFESSPLMPTATDPSKYTIRSATEDTAAIIDAGKKQIFDDVLKSKISSFVKMSQQHDIYMQQVYGIIEGNLNEGVQSLIMGSSTYAAIQAASDPIALIKLLRTVCRKEKGVDYSISTFHSCLSDLINCKQGNDNTITFMENIKLRYDVMTSQFGKDWLPNDLMSDVMTMHSPTPGWTSTTYATCTQLEQDSIETLTKDRLLAYIGVIGHTGKMPGGLTLKSHINNTAAINKNASVCYPENITDLLKLTSSIVTSLPSRNRHSNGGHSNGGQSGDNSRDGTQFTQTGTATQALMTAYDGDYDDSDMYGTVQFLQTAESWFDDDADLDHTSEDPRSVDAYVILNKIDGTDDDSTETTENHEPNGATSTVLNSSIYAHVGEPDQTHAQSESEFTIVRRANIKPVVMDNAADSVAARTEQTTFSDDANTSKFNHIINNLPDDAHINSAGATPTSDSERDDLLRVLRNVARSQFKTNPTGWADAVIYKLNIIGITTNTLLFASLPHLNTKLSSANHSTFHNTTLAGLAAETRRALAGDRTTISVFRPGHA
jgi:hypothetical protein